MRVGSVDVDRGGGGPGNWTERRDSDRLTVGGGGGGIDNVALEFGDGERREDGGVGRRMGAGTVVELISRRGVEVFEEGGVGNGAGVGIREAGIV